MYSCKQQRATICKQHFVNRGVWEDLFIAGEVCFDFLGEA